MQYTSSELALKIAASEKNSISIFQFVIKTLFGFHTYLLKTYNSYIVPFLPGTLYTINERKKSIKDHFICCISWFGRVFFYVTIKPHFSLPILQVNKHRINVGKEE